MTRLWVEYDSDGIAHVTQEGLRNGASVIWVPNSRNGGGTFHDGYGYRITTHEIQGGARYDLISRHPYPPHVWLDVSSRTLFQTVPLTRSAFALYQGSNVTTNRAKALQMELSGVTSLHRDETDEWLTVVAEMEVAPFCQFTALKGEQIDLDDTPDHTNVSGSASEYWHGRFSPSRWNSFRGHAGHIDVPDNDHWDPGAMDLVRISQHAKLIVAGKLETYEYEEQMLIAQIGESYFVAGSDMVYRTMTWGELQALKAKGVPVVAMSPQEWEVLKGVGRVA